MSSSLHKIVVVGLGNIGQGVHAPLVYQNERSQLWGVYEPRVKLTQKVLDYVKKHYKRTAPLSEQSSMPRIYEKFEDILKDDMVEAAILCVPHELHIPLSKQLLEHGKVVLCEKPLCTTSSAGADFLDYLKTNHYYDKVILGYMWRWDPAILQLKTYITNQSQGLSVHPQRMEEFFKTGGYNSWMGKYKPLSVWQRKVHPQKVRPDNLHSLAQSMAYEWLINVWAHQINLTQFLFAPPKLVRDVTIGLTGGSFSFVEEFEGFNSTCDYAWVKGNKFYRGMRIFYEQTAVNLELQVPFNREEITKIEIRERNAPVQTVMPSAERKWMYQVQFERFLDLLEKNYTRVSVPDNEKALHHALMDIVLSESVIKSYQKKCPITLERAS